MRFSSSLASQSVTMSVQVYDVANKMFSEWKRLAAVDPNNRDMAICKLCPEDSALRFIKRKKSNTTGIIDHMARHHGWRHVKISEDNPENSEISKSAIIKPSSEKIAQKPTKSGPMHKYLKVKLTFPQIIISKLTSSLGLSFRQLTDPLMRDILTKYFGQKSPSSVSTVNRTISSAAVVVKSEIIEKIISLKKKGGKFTAVTDEGKS